MTTAKDGYELEADPPSHKAKGKGAKTKVLPADAAQVTIDERLKALEEKLDRLMRRWGA